MDKEEIILKRLKELADLIKKHNYNYHSLDSPEITDQEFDKLVKENDTLEKNYPSFFKMNHFRIIIYLFFFLHSHGLSN